MIKKYLETNVSGVEVYVDKYIAKDGYLYFCSSFRGAESVKGAQAGFLSNMDWNIDGTRFMRLRDDYRQLTTKLTPALTHGIVFAKDFFDGNNVKSVNIVFGETIEEVKNMAFMRLKKITSIPLLDEWREEVFENTLSMLPLETFGIQYAYEVELPKDEILKEYVMANLDALTTTMEK